MRLSPPSVTVLFLSTAVVSLVCWRWWWSRLRSSQIHLSTLLLLSICAGGLMWLNMRPIRHGNLIGWPLSANPGIPGWTDDEENDRYDRYFGWPFLAVKPAFWRLSQGPDSEEFNFYVSLFVNGMTAVQALTGIAYVAESRVVRKRKPA